MVKVYCMFKIFPLAIIVFLTSSCAHSGPARMIDSEPIVNCSFKDGIISSVSQSKKITHKEQVIVLNQSASELLEFSRNKKILFTFSPWGVRQFKVATDLVVLDQFLSKNKRKAKIIAMDRDSKKVYKVDCHFPN